MAHDALRNAGAGLRPIAELPNAPSARATAHLSRWNPQTHRFGRDVWAPLARALRSPAAFLTIARDPSQEQTIWNKVNPNHEQEVISIVVAAELWSLVRQNGWGTRRLLQVETLLQKMVIIRIDSDLLVHQYVEINVFSQGKNPEIRLPEPDKSARNMGKNDLWRSAVAVTATASLFNLHLITISKLNNSWRIWSKWS